MGLSIRDISRALGVQERTVRRWELPAPWDGIGFDYSKTLNIPDDAWSRIDDMLEEFADAVEQLADQVKMDDKRLDDEARPVSVSYWRTQEQYEEARLVLGEDGGEPGDSWNLFNLDGALPLGFRNAAARELARILREQGRAVVVGYGSDEDDRASVLNSYGVQIDYGNALGFMDDDLREELASYLAPCTPQVFFEEYCRAHVDRFGLPLFLDSPNQDCLPDDWEEGSREFRTPFAVFSTDDESLCFYNRVNVPQRGSVYAGKEVDEVFLVCEPGIDPDFSRVADQVTSITFVDEGIAPASMHAWFSGFELLLDADLEKLDAWCCADMGSLFEDCGDLEHVYMKGVRTKALLNASRMFAGCTSLRRLDLSGFDTSQVNDMREMFSGCGMLTDLNVSDWDTSHVFDMRDMFKDCVSIEALDLSSFTGERVDSLAEMFAGCDALRSLDASRFDFDAQQTTADFMFDGCDALDEQNMIVPNTAAGKLMRDMLSSQGGESDDDADEFND